MEKARRLLGESYQTKHIQNQHRLTTLGIAGLHMWQDHTGEGGRDDSSFDLVARNIKPGHFCQSYLDMQTNLNIDLIGERVYMNQELVKFLHERNPQLTQKASSSDLLPHSDRHHIVCTILATLSGLFATIDVFSCQLLHSH